MSNYSETLTATHKTCVFQLHIHHSLSCMSLRQYRACIAASLGLKIITCITVLEAVLSPCLFYHPYIPHSNLFVYIHVQHRDFSCVPVNILLHVHVTEFLLESV